MRRPKLLKRCDERTGEILIVRAADAHSRVALRFLPSRAEGASDASIAHEAGPSLARATIGFIASLVLLVGASVAILAAGGNVVAPAGEEWPALRGSTGPE